ncbi:MULTISPECIES: SanA/YdcF family protein [Thiorhodovibrio]|uniref:SanA/YdcF family protein n=1 Tax=Thiorhodovibrio TaxID=61593 RepID=UPI0019134E54|nr:MULTISPECIES: ElyC/SanA/YdcF family protein [Thiorhodovibrio]
MPVALVLGTARRTHRGRPNQFYRARLEAAAALYHQGRVQGILVSGDNGSRYYNEPEAMRRDLIALGVPDAHVTLDYAGFRTLDSVVRAKRVFGLERFLIVSQSYHVERGVFIARAHGIDAYGYAAEDPGGAAGFRVRLREIGARVVAIWDVLSGREPKFLGEPEPVKVKADPVDSQGSESGMPSTRSDATTGGQPEVADRQADDATGALPHAAENQSDGPGDSTAAASVTPPNSPASTSSSTAAISR